jgi:predicted nuclease of predicted toxin-antitoxin system
MKILFDQGTPVPLRRYLNSHTVSTSFENGWSALKNGQLLNAAEDTFDLLITTDQQLRYQQNLASRKIAILVLTTTSWPQLRSCISRICEAVEKMKTGDYVEFSLD